MVAVVELRFTRLASASVPILTGQRSPLHWARVRPGRKTSSTMQRDDSQRNRFIVIFNLGHASDENRLRSELPNLKNTAALYRGETTKPLIVPIPSFGGVVENVST